MRYLFDRVIKFLFNCVAYDVIDISPDGDYLNIFQYSAVVAIIIKF